MANPAVLSGSEECWTRKSSGYGPPFYTPSASRTEEMGNKGKEGGEGGGRDYLVGDDLQATCTQCRAYVALHLTRNLQASDHAPEITRKLHRIHCVVTMRLWPLVLLPLALASKALQLPLPSALPPALSEVFNTLATLQRSPTCYRAAATLLMQFCKSLPSDIPDPERIQFAIKLTVCELDLIQQTPALCRVEERWNECVRALAKRDHWWTSFSGNLRQVSNVCWIGRHEVEKGLKPDFPSDVRSIIGITFEFDGCAGAIAGGSPGRGAQCSGTGTATGYCPGELGFLYEFFGGELGRVVC